MSSKFFTSRNEPKNNPKVDTKSAPSTRTNIKRQSQPKKSGRGK
jgi:hypothetical protein